MEENKIKKIADDVCAVANEEFLKQKKYIDYKWVKSGENQMTRISADVFYDSIFDTIQSLKNNSAYIAFKTHLESLESVQSIIPIAGFHTQPERLVAKLIEGAFLPLEKRFDSKKLLEKLDELIKHLSDESHVCILIGRLHGIKFETNLIDFDENISLIRLDDNAFNERQPLIIKASYGGSSVIDYSNSNVEIKIKGSYPIVPHKESFYYEMVTKAQIELELKLRNVVKALKLYFRCNCEVYPYSISSPLYQGGQFSRIEPRVIFENVALSSNDIDGLKKAFSIVSNDISKDKILDRSLSRFLIGINERVPEERIVDFVIAWESLLLTEKNHSIKNESSYRFSLNGAAILSVTNNSLEFTDVLKLMKVVYGIRSTIVHGGDTNSLAKEVKKIGFANLDELNIKLSNWFRDVVFWLASIEKEDRPYCAEFGWEKLIRRT